MVNALRLERSMNNTIAHQQFRSIRRLILLALAAEAWMMLRFVPYSGAPLEFGSAAVAMSAFAILGWSDRWARVGSSGALIVLLAVVIRAFPENANHQFLALALLALIKIADQAPEESPEDQRIALQCMRWIALGGLAWAGIMKLLYGVWFRGEFLAYRIAQDPAFDMALGWILPDAERARLLALGSVVGAGPFRAESASLVILSNLTWIAECLIPIGLFYQPTRRFALIAGIAFILAIEAGAREFFFASMMIGLLLLFSNRDRIGPILPAFGLASILWVSAGYWR